MNDYFHFWHWSFVSFLKIIFPIIWSILLIFENPTFTLLMFSFIFSRHLPHFLLFSTSFGFSLLNHGAGEYSSEFLDCKIKPINPKGIEYHLHCSWRSQSSGKVEKANDIIKRHLCKLIQKMKDKCIRVLPIALMRAQTAPKKRGTVPLWIYLWRTFLTHRHCYRP